METPSVNRLLAYARAIAAGILLGAVPAAAQTDARIVGSRARPERRAGARCQRCRHQPGYRPLPNGRHGPEGYFTVTGLKPAVYTIRVTTANFAPTEYTDMKLAAAQELSLDFEIRPQGVTESVHGRRRCRRRST